MFSELNLWAKWTVTNNINTNHDSPIACSPITPSRWLSICLKDYTCAAIITRLRLKLRCIKCINTDSLNRHKSILESPVVQSCALFRRTGWIPNNAWESAPVTNQRKWCIAHWLGTMQPVLPEGECFYPINLFQWTEAPCDILNRLCVSSCCWRHLLLFSNEARQRASANTSNHHYMHYLWWGFQCCWTFWFLCVQSISLSVWKRTIVLLK